MSASSAYIVSFNICLILKTYIQKYKLYIVCNIYITFILFFKQTPKIILRTSSPLSYDSKTNWKIFLMVNIWPFDWTRKLSHHKEAIFSVWSQRNQPEPDGHKFCQLSYWLRPHIQYNRKIQIYKYINYIAYKSIRVELPADSFICTANCKIRHRYRPTK